MSDKVTEFKVNGQQVVLVRKPLSCLPVSNFGGQKILHPFKTETTEITVTIKKKDGSSYTKKVPDMHYVDEYSSENAKEALENPLDIHVKLDGSCGLIKVNTDADGKMTWVGYARFDLSFKEGKLSAFGKIYEKEEDLPSGMIPCETDPRATSKYENYGKLHWPFMVPFAKSDGKTVDVIQCIEGLDAEKQYKWNILAFKNAVSSGKLNDLTHDITVEQMGQQFSLKECDDFSGVGIVPHGSLQLSIPRELLTFEGLCQVLIEIPNMEGLVIYGTNGTVWKFRREMIQVGSAKLEWPDKSAAKTDWAFKSALL